MNVYIKLVFSMCKYYKHQILIKVQPGCSLSIFVLGLVVNFSYVSTATHNTYKLQNVENSFESVTVSVTVFIR